MTGYRPRRDFNPTDLLLMALFFVVGPALVLIFLATGGTR